MLNFLNSFAKFHPYNLAVTINIGDGFFTDLEINNDKQAGEYLKIFFDHIRTNTISTEAINFINSNFSNDSKNKTLLHYSSIIHESKHFHDYILSPCRKLHNKKIFLFICIFISYINRVSERK